MVRLSLCLAFVCVIVATLGAFCAIITKPVFAMEDFVIAVLFLGLVCIEVGFLWLVLTDGHSVKMRRK